MPPTYNIPANGVVEIQMLGRLHAQRTRNVFHYLYDGTTPLAGPDTLDAMAEEFAIQVVGPLLTQQSAEFTLEQISVQLVAPVRYRARFSNMNVPGGVQGQSLPSSTTVVLRRQGIAAGKRYQGRIFVPGVPVTHEADSMVAVAQRAAWNLAAEALKEPLEGGTQTSPFVPVISWKAGVTTLDQVVETALDPVLRVQRRREVGVGE